jgi:hypothetical protein
MQRMHRLAYANVMALVLPTSWSFFYVGNTTGLVLPTNLLGMDGLRRGEGILSSFYGTLFCLLCLSSSLRDSFLG